MLYDPKWEVPAEITNPDRQHFLDAAAYMELHGHCRGRMEDASGAVCLVGALMKTSPAPTDALYCQRIVSRLSRSIGAMDIVGWSDHPHRTKAEVIAALRKAAE